MLTSEPNVNNVRIVENNSNSGASQTTLLISKPHAEHENKPNLSKSAILENTRSQIQTQKTQDSIKAIQWCLRRGGHSYRYSNDLVSHLVSAKDVLRLDALSLPRNSCAVPFISPRLHRLCFETFDERAPFARPFDAVLERNKAIDDKITIMGIRVHVARYFRGKVIIMPYLDEKPLPQSQLRPFLEAVRSALGLEPPIDLWGVTFAEVNADIPLSDLPKEKLYEIFKYRDETLRAYTKNIQGQAYLRIESIIDPDRMKLAQFERKAELASETLQHFAKRLA